MLVPGTKNHAQRVPTGIPAGPSFVVEMAPGGSAELSGKVRIRDELLRVDGETIQGMTPVELSHIISGPEGTTVRLAFLRMTNNFFGEAEETFEITLQRRVPQGASVTRYTIGAPPNARMGSPVSAPARDRDLTPHMPQPQASPPLAATPPLSPESDSLPSIPIPNMPVSSIATPPDRPAAGIAVVAGARGGGASQAC